MIKQCLVLLKGHHKKKLNRPKTGLDEDSELLLLEGILISIHINYLSLYVVDIRGLEQFTQSKVRYTLASSWDHISRLWLLSEPKRSALLTYPFPLQYGLVY